MKKSLSVLALLVVGFLLRPVGAETATELIFTPAGGATCRLTCCGEGVWRLLSQGADPKGAVQAFAAWMGENDPCPARPFDVTCAEDGTLTAVSADGSRLVVSKDGALAGFAANRENPAVELIRLTTVTNRTTLTGRLAPAEEIYGLGERLDAVGKRGSSVSLWSTDGFAQRGTTYLPIPFFSTTRGGGVFVNSYRRATADFGKTVAEVWSFDVDEGCADVYLITRSNPAEVLRVAARLQGGTEAPPDWSRGPIICRLAPDFGAWDGPCFSKRGDRQLLGTGIASVLEGHLELDAKPTAFLLEGFAPRVFAEKESLRTAERARLADACAKLAEQGMKAMRYIRVGQVPYPYPDADFKPEFLVHADIYTNGVLVRANTDLIPDAPRPGRNPDVTGDRHAFRHLDITNPEAWKWYLDTVWKVYGDSGIRGAKIDFCELFPEENETYGTMQVRFKWHDPSVFSRGALHHAYAPFFVARFVREMRARYPEDGFFALTRGGGIGSGRFPGVWAGDQLRDETVAADQLRAILNAGLSGVPFLTYDMAGYRYAKEAFRPAGAVNVKSRRIRLGEEPQGKEQVLYRRGAQKMNVFDEANLFLNSLYTAYTPCLQTHGCVRHVYEFDPETIAAYRRVVRHKAALAPYMERLARDAVETGLPPVRHLILAWPDDPNVRAIDDAFLLGDALLVAPIFNGQPREVYLPAGAWYDVLAGTRLEVAEGGRRLPVQIRRGEVPLYVNLRSAAAQEVLSALGAADSAAPAQQP